MVRIKVILVDDHQLITDSFERLLKDIEDIELVEAIPDLAELLTRLNQIYPNVILINLYNYSDIELPVLKIISDRFPKIKILINNLSDYQLPLADLMKAGVYGILNKDSNRQQLLEAIYSLRGGYDYFNNAISDTLLKNLVSDKNFQNPMNKQKNDILTKRELEILKLFSEGQSNRKIAAGLFISVKTVESHKNNMMQKLKIKSSVDLVKYAIRNNLTRV